ncbi:MAG: DUF2061 domain-containing protein [Cyclobacteriaceae bacterium]|nr:DUF2061 domain-containing protein [Cyclobacteriaceae bacterium]
MKESKRRSLVKGLTYRGLATLATFSIALGFTGSLSASIQIGMADFIIKMTLFFVNDRVWNSIQWGYITAKK